jgi:hypothetical protein
MNNARRYTSAQRRDEIMIEVALYMSEQLSRLRTA